VVVDKRSPDVVAKSDAFFARASRCSPVIRCRSRTSWTGATSRSRASSAGESRRRAGTRTDTAVARGEERRLPAVAGLRAPSRPRARSSWRQRSWRGIPWGTMRTFLHKDFVRAEGAHDCLAQRVTEILLLTTSPHRSSNRSMAATLPGRAGPPVLEWPALQPSAQPGSRAAGTTARAASARQTARSRRSDLTRPCSTKAA
jgi:hypothetical protein